MTLVDESNPSISTRIWFRVCSRSSCPAPEARAPMPADGVDLIDEHYAGRVTLGLVEQVADAGGADADEHLYELAAAYGEEGNAGLSGNRPAEQGLARARRPDQQHAPRDPGPEGGELLREAEELHHFLQVLLGFFNPGHVQESHGGLVANEHAGPAPAEAQGLVAAPLGLSAAGTGGPRRRRSGAGSSGKARRGC